MQVNPQVLCLEQFPHKISQLIHNSSCIKPDNLECIVRGVVALNSKDQSATCGGHCNFTSAFPPTISDFRHFRDIMICHDMS